MQPIAALRSPRAVIAVAGVAIALLFVVSASEAQAATVDDCIAGTYFDAESSTCVPAEKGSFVADDRASTQTPCPPGRFQDQTGQTTCKVVPAGSEATGQQEDGSTATGERLCPVGSFQDEAQKVRCKVIPLGSGGTGGNADGRGATAAVLCAPGTFRSDAATTSCAATPVGTFTSVTGATSSTPCPVGRYQDATGSTACKEVPAGSEGTGGGSDGVRATGVRLCLEGTFQANAGGGACTPAGEGSFVATRGATASTPCPAGRYQPDTGRTDCVAAPAGSHVPVSGSRAAALCPAGTYSPTTGATACTAASVGSYVPRPGSTAQLRCISAMEPGLSRCPVPTTAPTAPTPDAPATGDDPLSPQGDECPPGTWSATGTSRAGSSCTPASPGAFVPTAGATAELLCPSGTYSDGFGASECTVAPIGTFVAGAGAMDPSPCPGATVPGLTECPESLAAPGSESDGEPAGSRSVVWWAVGLLLALGAGGAGFLLLQRRTGVLDAGGPEPSGTDGTLVDLPGLDTTVTDLAMVRGVGPGAQPGVGPDVLEWDEALDGRLDGDETPPPPNPQS